jgi:hypothetical protein
MNRLTIALLLGSLAVSIGCKKPPPPATPVAAGPPAEAKPMPAQIPPVLARVNSEAINYRHRQICEEGAKPPGGMHRRPNAGAFMR